MTQQNSQRWYLLGRTSRRFLWCWWWLLLFLPHWRFFISLPFDVIPHLFVSYHRVFTPILYFQPRSSQSDLWHFHFNFSRLFYCKCYHFEWVFFTHWRFLLYTPSFVTQIEQKHSIQDPPLCLLSQSCPPADAWTWTIDVWIIRPLIYQLRQWATKYRVKIEPLNMFCLFNVICKDY